MTRRPFRRLNDGERLHFGLVRSQRRLLSPSSRQGEGIGKMQELPNWSRFVDLDGMGFRHGLSPVTASRARDMRTLTIWHIRLA